MKNCVPILIASAALLAAVPGPPCSGNGCCRSLLPSALLWEALAGRHPFWRLASKAISRGRRLSEVLVGQASEAFPGRDLGGDGRPISLQARVFEEGVIRRLTETFSSLESVLQPPFVVGGDFNTFRSAGGAIRLRLRSRAVLGEPRPQVLGLPLEHPPRRGGDVLGPLWSRERASGRPHPHRPCDR